MTAARGATGTTGAVPFLDLDATTRPVLDEVLRGWRTVVESSSFIGGREVADFEEGFARLCGTRDAVATANGTDALHLVLRALDLGPGDEVVVPSNTFVATAEAVVLAGARLRFADVDPDTLLLSPRTLAAAVTPRTRAVVVVHLYGRMPDLPALLDTAGRLGLVVVEDAAQAHGATWQGRPAGSFGVAGAFSFYPGKNLGAFGDAGAVVTSDPVLAERVRCLRDHGRAAGSHHRHDMVGTNSRLDALQAVVLNAKLTRLGRWNDERRAVVAAYDRGLDPDRAPLVTELPGSRGAHHLAVVRVAEREAVRRRLAERGIGTGIHYPVPCHLMKPYAEWAAGPLPAAEVAADEVLSLPLHPGMDPAVVDRVVEAVNEAAPVRDRA